MGMNKEDIRGYLFYLGRVYKSPRKHYRMVDDILEICERQLAFLKISEYETSIPLDRSVPKARIIHYVLVKDDLKNRYETLKNLSLRVRDLLIYSKFDYKIFDQIFEDFIKLGIEFPHSVASIEWDIKRLKIEKISLYFSYNRLTPKVKNLISLKMQIKKDVIDKVSKKLEYIAFDFFKDGNFSLKVYNKYKYQTSMELFKWEREFIDRYKLEECLDYCVRSSRFSQDNASLLEKTHFIFKKTKTEELTRRFDFKSYIHPYLKWNFERKKIIISVNNALRPVELYFM